MSYHDIDLTGQGNGDDGVWSVGELEDVKGGVKND
jgi:hypothetical protein